MKEKKEKEENKIYLIKGGKQVVSIWEFMQQTGTLDRMKQKGITINPTHSFELLKQTRQELFEKAKQNFSEERKMKKLATSDFEISCLYYSWLKGELNTIENWLSDTYPNGKKRLKPSTSDQIEILKYKQYVNNEMTQAENEISLPQPIVESPFSVLEWATIFYYADETKLLSESPLLKTRLEQFMSKHQINTTFDNFKTKYYDAKKRINEKKDYPINKLELIIPFLKENYKQTVTKVENDIFFLEENKPEY